MHRRRVGTRGIALVLVAAAGCTSWHVESAAPAEVIARQPAQIRIRRPDGQRVVVHAPRIAGDSISGYARASGAGDASTGTPSPAPDVTMAVGDCTAGRDQADQPGEDAHARGWPRCRRGGGRHRGSACGVARQ